ncbi:LuxR C-terminal-related transcriptional regulator [Azospirillum rugosum]|uniref:DNA-binding NarL/FixJ family response regulator n=1 Tax=Azospirillum rugosum TaxID=416170 RepID=A0ABS4SFV6_9PROT|nr:response regulator transcription factor [Azospirillum rugosum]MBP2291448.1 DNA-binding NarL/FixJ family response regulator [Azospirillum rugosum]MDQ0525236.1 DNA-binding NarL/FixJ family response regulator [Azospirillum rugosum]
MTVDTNKVAQGITKARSAKNITVLLLDDMLLTRECLSLSINLCDRGVRVLTAASTADAQPLLYSETAPDVVLYNCSALAPPETDFAAQIRDIIACLGDTPLIVLSDREDGETVVEAFQLGVRGYISTAVGLSVALEAIRLIAAGGTFVPPSFMHRLIQDHGILGERSATDDASLSPGPNGTAIYTNAEDSSLYGLTPRQLSVLECLKEGKPNKIIAHELGMQESTVKVHVRSILKKLGVTNRTEAVYRTLRQPDA